MKNKRLLILLLIIAFLIIGIFIYIQKKHEWKPTEENLTNYEAVYHEFPVQFLRHAFDAYLENDSSKACILQVAVTKSGAGN